VVVDVEWSPQPGKRKNQQEETPSQRKIRHCKHSPPKKRNGDTPLGYSGGSNVTCISIAREQLGKHIPAKKNSWQTIGKGFPLLGNEQ
jgi:hypothetical protein